MCRASAGLTAAGSLLAVSLCDACSCMYYSLLCLSYHREKICLLSATCKIKKKENTRERDQKEEKKEREREKESDCFLVHIFFFSHSRPMSQHQTLTLLSKAGGSIDSIFSPPCCCDPETALWQDLDTRRENDGGDIKRKRVVDNNSLHSLFLSYFFFPPFLPACPPSLPLLSHPRSLNP